MIAAIYARKSTDQKGVHEDAKSVTRQVGRSRQYAEKHGWTVDDRYLYVDDDIKGDVFGEKRPGLFSLLTALKPRPPFQALVMMESERLGREQIETSWWLQQIMSAGVEVWFYLADKKHTYKTAMDKGMAAMGAFAGEMEKERAAVRSYDAAAERAEHGYVTGGLLYGYDNHREMNGGLRGRVKRVINEAQAVTIRRIFALCTEGKSTKKIARLFNAEAIPPPRPRRPGTERLKPSWSGSAIRAMIYNPHYKGVVIWNKTMTVAQDDGKKKKVRVTDESKWITAPPDPTLAIVTEAEWQAAHDRLSSSRNDYLRTTGGKLHGRPCNGLESNYLLVGNARCTVCNGSLGVRRDFDAGDGCYKYACITHHERGPHACTNAVELPMTDMDHDVLAVILQQVLHPKVVFATAQRAVVAARRGGPNREIRRKLWTEEIATLDAERGRLAQAIADGGQLPALLDALTKKEARLKQLTDDLAALDLEAGLTDLDLKRMEQDLAKNPRFQEWPRILTGNVAKARQLLRAILGGRRMGFTPKLIRGKWGYAFTGQAELGRVLSGFSVIADGGVPNGI